MILTVPTEVRLKDAFKLVRCLIIVIVIDVRNYVANSIRFKTITF